MDLKPRPLPTIVALAVMVALIASAHDNTTRRVHSQTGWCPPSGDRAYATARLALSGDYSPIVKGTEVLEVADPYLNPCDGLLPGQRWVSQLMWLVDDSGASVRAAEIGWRRTCTLTGPKTWMYAAAGTVPGTTPRYFADARGNPVVAGPGSRWIVTLAYDGGGAQDVWRATISGPIGANQQAYEQTFAAPSGFTGARIIEVGGENLYKLNDMGVAGHLDPAYLLANGTLGYMVGNQNVRIFRHDAPRYDITEGDSGWADSVYFQNFSDIHWLATPTPGAPDNCS